MRLFKQSKNNAIVDIILERNKFDDLDPNQVDLAIQLLADFDGDNYILDIFLHNAYSEDLNPHIRNLNTRMLSDDQECH